MYEIIHGIERISWYEFDMRHERVGVNVAW